MKKGKIISFFIAIFMIITSLPIRVYAQQNPSLTVTAVKENEEPCSNIYFSIFLNNQLIKKEKTDSSRKVDLPDVANFDAKVLLAMEKEMLGVYIIDHPLNASSRSESVV